MAGIIPDNFSVDMGQQLMSNIVNLYAQKQQLDEKRKLEDERYKREQQIWNERQTSTEEREKRMSEYQMNLRLQAETESTINEYKKQNAAKMMDWRQNYLTLISSDENFKQKELQRVGSQEALEKVIQNVQNLTFDQIYKEANNSFNGANELLQSNLYQVEKEKAEKYLEKNPNKKAIMKEVINQGLDPYKISESQIKEIENQLLPKLELIEGKPGPKSVNTIAAGMTFTESEKNELDRYRTNEQWEEAQNYLLGLQSQRATAEEQRKNEQRLKEIKLRQSDKSQSGETKTSKESIDYQNQYNSLNKSLQEAKSKGNDSLIKSIENKIVNVKADAAKKGITIKENQTNISTQIKSNPIIQNAVNAIYSEQKKGSDFDADIIKKSLQTIESNYNPESASSIENFILKNKSRFEEALNLWGDARKSDAITRLLREFEEKGMQKSKSINFNSIQEAEKANLPKGTIIYINGRKAVIE